MIRVYEPVDKGAGTHPGTIVQPSSRELSIYADSAEEAEQRIRNSISSGGLPAGKVYQICPWLANPELIRSVAASLDGRFQRVFLDPAVGLYSELRRIRLPRAQSGQQDSVGLTGELAESSSR